MPKRSSTKLTRRKVATESRIPLVRSGVSSRKLEGFSPGKNSERMYCRISSFMLSMSALYRFSCRPRISNPQTLRNQVALDFRSSRIQRAAESVAQFPLDALLHHIAIAAVDLKRVRAGLHQGFGNVQLGDGRFHRGRLVPLLQPANPVDQRPARVQPDFHVDDAVGHRLELADRLAKLLPGAHVFDATL